MGGKRRINLAFVPPAKTMKLDEKIKGDIISVQDELNKLAQECLEERRTVMRKFESLKNKQFQSRGDLVREVPGFWKKVLVNFGIPRGLIHWDEVQVLDYLEDVRLDENSGNNSHKFTFAFTENPYFKEKEISKEIKIENNVDVVIEVTPITYTKNPLANRDLSKEELRSATFFGWLQSVEDECWGDDFGSEFRADAWPEAVKFFKGEISSGDDDDDVESEIINVEDSEEPQPPLGEGEVIEID